MRQYLGEKQARRSAVELVGAVFDIPESVRSVEWPHPGVPWGAIGQLHLDIDDDLADVVQQGRVGNGHGPGLRLGSLGLCPGPYRQQVGLSQLQGVDHDLQAVVEHAAGIRMMMVFRGGQLLDQLGVALDGDPIEFLELLA